MLCVNLGCRIKQRAQVSNVTAFKCLSSALVFQFTDIDFWAFFRQKAAFVETVTWAYLVADQRGYNSTTGYVDKLCRYFSCQVENLLKYVADEVIQENFQKKHQTLTRFRYRPWAVKMDVTSCWATLPTKSLIYSMNCWRPSNPKRVGTSLVRSFNQESAISTGPPLAPRICPWRSKIIIQGPQGPLLNNSFQHLNAVTLIWPIRQRN